MAPRAPDSLHRPLWPPPRVECAQSWDGQRWLRAWAPIPQGGRTCNRPPGKAPAPAQLTPSDLAPASPGIGPSEAALGRRWARGTLWLRAHAPRDPCSPGAPAWPSEGAPCAPASPRPAALTPAGDVHAEVHAVDEVHIQGARPHEHAAVARCLPAPPRVGSLVLRPQVRLRLHDAPTELGAVPQVSHQDLHGAVRKGPFHAVHSPARPPGPPHCPLGPAGRQVLLTECLVRRVRPSWASSPGLTAEDTARGTPPGPRPWQRELHEGWAGEHLGGERGQPSTGQSSVARGCPWRAGRPGQQSRGAGQGLRRAPALGVEASTPGTPLPPFATQPPSTGGGAGRVEEGPEGLWAFTRWAGPGHLRALVRGATPPRVPVPPRPCPCHLASCPECHRGPFRRAGVLVAPPPDVPLLVAGPEREHLLRPEGTPEWSGCRWLLPAMICLRTRA